MKKLNSKGFSHLEVLLTILVVVAVVGIGYFGYQRFQTNNGTKAAAASRVFTRYPGQMSGGKLVNGKRHISGGYGTLAGLEAHTLVSAAEVNSSKKICASYGGNTVPIGINLSTNGNDAYNGTQTKSGNTVCITTDLYKRYEKNKGTVPRVYLKTPDGKKWANGAYRGDVLTIYGIK